MIGAAVPSSPATQLREYYDALHALKEHEQTVLAEAHAADPTLILHRFNHSLQAFNAPIDEPFYITKRSDPANSLCPPGQINSTIEFAAQIADGAAKPVLSSPTLAFRYIDRELSPLRTTGSDRPARRSLDLLLANDNDALPIYAELKIGTDRPSYFALVQLLALATDLLPPSQRQRLKQHPGGSRLRWPQTGPYADLYIITLNSPTTGKYRARSLAATQQISKKLIDDELFSAQIRRIAYLEAVPENNTLRFDTQFAYGEGL